MMSSGINLITTIIGFGLGATFIVFVCSRLICERLRQLEDRQMFEIDTSRIDLELPEHQINGLEPVVVDAIPTMKFNLEAFSSMEDAQCSICLAEYQEKEVLRIMPKCGHSFHLSCIDVWLRKQSTCPVCRLSVQQGYLETKHSPTTTTPHSFDSSEIITLEEDHSHQWLLPTISRAQGHERNQMRSDSISIELESEVSRETILRSSSLS